MKEVILRVRENIVDTKIIKEPLTKIIKLINRDWELGSWVSKIIDKDILITESRCWINNITHSQENGSDDLD